MDDMYRRGLENFHEEEKKALETYLRTKAHLDIVKKELQEVRDRIVAFKESHGVYQNPR